MQISFRNLWPWYFFAAALESFVFIAILFSIPSESGLSLARFAMISVLLLILILSVGFGLHARHDTAALDALRRAPLIAGATLLFLTSGLALFLLRYLNPERLLPFYERLSPLLWFLFVVGLQSALFLLFLQNGLHRDELLKRKDIYRSACFVFVALLLLLAFVAVTRLGITPDPAYWGEPGVAILGWHFGLAILIGFAVLLCFAGFASFRLPRVQNYILPFAIWLTASVLWLSVPWDVLQNSFYAPISPPTNIPLPYSDAGYYDYISQSLLTGTDYLGLIPPRPLYIFLLAGLHALFGQDYVMIIAGQTLLLALFPVVLYFLAKKLHSPAAGVTAAFFAIFREYLGLWISSNTRVVNSKIFTTDFPTALGLAVLCLIVMWWFERREIKSTLIAGGSFGLLLLLRTQSLIILPFVFILAWFAFQRQTKQWGMACIAFVLAMAVTITPWLIHNYTVTGKFAFDDPSQMAIIYSQYSFSDNNDLSQFDFQSESLGNRLLNFALANPGFVAGFITNHFLNTQIGGLLSLPLIERYDGIFEPVNLYWVEWNGTLPWYNLLLVVVYLAVLAVGFAAAWRRLRWIGLVPLTFCVGYALSNGIARFSSWRYNMPVDWVIYFYFAIGLVETLAGLVLLFGGKVEKILPALSNSPGSGAGDFNLRGRFLGSLIAILAVSTLAGALPWLAKGLVPQRFTATNEQLVAQLAADDVPSAGIEAFLSQPNAVIMEGRLLYPRMYRRDQGISSAHPWPAYAVRDFPRLGFIFMNEHRYDGIFMTRQAYDFPQGADAILLGCQRDGYIETRLIQFGTTSYRSAPLTEPCN
ncbi:MAG: glycosyltransferase family 39 protein [Chloroflexota bacterium]